MSAKHTQRGQEARRSAAFKAVPELEMKFLVAPGGLAVVKNSPIFKNKSMRIRLKTVYYDTADFDLHRGGISLRVRHVGGAFIQTVKRLADLGLFDRDEWESNITGERPDPSAWAETPVPSILGHRGLDTLAPVFSTAVQRTIRLWKERTSLVEISLDQGELVAGDLCEPIEGVELELKKGNVTDLFSVARRLGADTILKLSFASNAQRGYGLIGQERSAALMANTIEIFSDMSADAAFASAARSCLAQVATNAELLRQTRTCEALHQLRVGLRRLQAAFAIFKPLFVNAQPDRLKAETKWLVHELNPARELDVFISTGFNSAKADSKSGRMLSELGKRLLLAQSEAYSRALAAVDSARFAALLLDCAEWAEVAPWRRSDGSSMVWTRDGSASVRATQALERLRRKVRKSGKNLTTLKPAARHKIRIKAKQLRYTAEFFAETFGKTTSRRHRKFLSSLKTLLDSLGELSDMTAARQNAAAVAGNSAEVAFRAGRIIGASDRDEPKLLAKAVRAYERWRRMRSFWH